MPRSSSSSSGGDFGAPVVVTPIEIISIVQLVIFVPIFLASAFVLIRHGLKRGLGWLFLMLFAFFRILSSLMIILTEALPSDLLTLGLFDAAYDMQEAAFVLLMFATYGFFGLIAQGADLPTSKLPVQLMFYMLLAVALVLNIAVDVADDIHTQRIIDSGGTQTLSDLVFDKQIIAVWKTRQILLIILYFAFVCHIIYFWVMSSKLRPRRRNFLLAMTFALPFLAARLLWTFLITFARDSLTVVTKFGISNDPPPIVYGFLAVLPEFIVVLTYTFIGMILRFNDDIKEGSEPGAWPQIYAPQGYAPQGYTQQAQVPQGYAPQTYAPQNYAPQGYSPQIHNLQPVHTIAYAPQPQQWDQKMAYPAYHQPSPPFGSINSSPSPPR